MKQEFILIRGLPGSGKSTLAKNIRDNQQYNFNWFEADQYFLDHNGDYVFDAKKLPEAHRQCLANSERALSKGYNVIVSNTFTTKKELKPYFDIAKNMGITPQVILMQNNYGSIHDVPEATLQRMKDRFEYDISDLFKN